MKVILNQDIKKLGKKHDVVKVSEGYARNYLFPKNLANPVENQYMNEAKGKIDSAKFKKQESIKESNKLKEILETKDLTFKIKVGKNGKLFGSVTEKVICDKLNEIHNLKLDKRKVVIKSPIKSLGEYDVTIKLNNGISSKIKIKVQE